MNRYDIEVRPTSSTDFFQYYTETVKAPTTSDAIKRVERMNPGANCTCINIEYGDGDSSSYSSSGGGCGLFELGVGGVIALAALIGLGVFNSDTDDYQPQPQVRQERVQSNVESVVMQELKSSLTDSENLVKSIFSVN